MSGFLVIIIAIIVLMPFMVEEIRFIRMNRYIETVTRRCHWIYPRKAK